ncbi:MAG TPA: hypothetical protein VGM41_20680 [Chitinophagaceae bacterium]|jgi:hypothetical protein
MVEVFKTDVKDRRHAYQLVEQIHETFGDYTANFDLHDCDRILRVKCTTGFVQAPLLVELLKDYGVVRKYCRIKCSVVSSCVLSRR